MAPLRLTRRCSSPGLLAASPRAPAPGPYNDAVPRSSAENHHPAPAPSADGKAEPLVIGWREYVAFPDWGVGHVQAKSDTGARSGALDVDHIERLDEDRVRFELVLRRKPDLVTKTIEAPIARVTRVRSSFGQRHERLFVEARIRIGPVEKTVELGLISRHRMICRVLLGRQALAPEFVVHPEKRYLFGRGPRAARLGEAEPAAGKKRSRKQI